MRRSCCLAQMSKNTLPISARAAVKMAAANGAILPSPNGEGLNGDRMVRVRRSLTADCHVLRHSRAAPVPPGQGC